MPKPETPAFVADPNIFFGCYLAGLAAANIRGASSQLSMAKDAWAAFSELVEWANTKAEADIAATRKKQEEIAAKKIAQEAADKAGEEAARDKRRKEFAEREAQRASA